MTELNKLTIADASEGIKAKKFSSVELTKACLDAAEKHNNMGSYIIITREKALEQAKASDAKIASGSVGLIEGIPVGVKDLFCTNGTMTTAGSKILGKFVPPYESTVTTKLFNQGMVMVGKTNLDEFAMGSTNLTSAYGKVVNPWKRKSDKAELTPGGSSGGSAAAVASYTCLGALGTDTGGSIRQPASFCGIVGIKPTYGRCSRYGVVAFASSLDQAGPMTRSVKDAAIMLEAMSGHDPKDSTSSLKAVPKFSDAIGQSIKGLRIGIPKEFRMEGMPKEIEKIWHQGTEWLKAAGAEVREVSLPHTKYGLPVYYILAPAEASSNLSRYDGVRYGARVMPERGGINELYEETRGAGFGREVKRRILIGTYVLSHGYYDAYYKKAQRVRTLISQDYEKVFQDVDLVLGPTTPSAAFGLNEKFDGPVKMYLNDVFTVSVNLAWLPAISVPAGFDGDGLPLGLQLIGRPFDEETCFKAAHVIEDSAALKLNPEGF